MSSTVGPAGCSPGRLPLVDSTMLQVARWGDRDDESVGPVRGSTAVDHRPVGQPWGGAVDAPWSGRGAALSPRGEGRGLSHRRKRNVTHRQAGGRLPARGPSRHAARRRHRPGT